MIKDHPIWSSQGFFRSIAIPAGEVIYFAIPEKSSPRPEARAT